MSWLLLASVASASPDLAGTWRVEWVSANQARVPILGPTTVYTRQVSLGTVTARPEGGWEQAHEVCAISATSDSSFTSTRFPDGFVKALPSKRYPLDVVEGADGWTLRADLGPLAIGYRPGAGSALPTTIDDPTVYDWDDDGSPGATIQIRAPLFGSVDVFIVQSSRGVLDGVIHEEEGLATEVTGSFFLADFAQATIGASNRLFHTTPRTTFLPDQSRLVMSRIPAGSTCDDLR